MRICLVFVVLAVNLIQAVPQNVRLSSEATIVSDNKCDSYVRITCSFGMKTIIGAGVIRYNGDIIIIETVVSCVRVGKKRDELPTICNITMGYRDPKGPTTISVPGYATHVSENYGTKEETIDEATIDVYSLIFGTDYIEPVDINTVENIGAQERRAYVCELMVSTNKLTFLNVTIEDWKKCDKSGNSYRAKESDLYITSSQLNLNSLDNGNPVILYDDSTLAGLVRFVLMLNKAITTDVSKDTQNDLDSIIVNFNGDVTIKAGLY